MKKTVFIPYLIISCILGVYGNDKPDIIYRNNFDDGKNIPTLCRGARYLEHGGINGSGCLKFSYEKPRDEMVAIRLDNKFFSGKRIRIAALIKAENIDIPTKSYLGPKLMLSLIHAGKKSWPNTKIPLGSYNYTRFSRIIQMPSEVTAVTLNIGLQSCKGTLYFDDVIVEVLPEIKQSYTENFIKPSKKLQTMPKYRGVMISPHRMKKNHWRDIEVLSHWGGNLIRYQMNHMTDGAKLTNEEYLKWLDSEIKNIDDCIAKCKQYNIQVIIDIHRGPGTKKSSVGSNILSWDKASIDTLLQAWRRLAKHYKGNKTVYAYELLNEPREDGSFVPEAYSWYSVAPQIAAEIRKIDPITPIIISPLHWSNPEGFYYLKPYNIPGLIYTVHVYTPHKFTHQGIKRFPDTVKYPGKINDIEWNKERLRNELKVVRDFQLKYNVPVFVGEFSAIRWAPENSAERYLQDCIELFEEYGWDWTYHAFREYHGWSVEHTTDKRDTKRRQTTSRKELLLKYFRRNK